jgi:hypothetical protein
MEYLLSISNDTPTLLKKLAVLDLDHKIKTPLVINEIIALDLQKSRKAAKKLA